MKMTNNIMTTTGEDDRKSKPTASSTTTAPTTTTHTNDASVTAAAEDKIDSSTRENESKRSPPWNNQHKNRDNDDVHAAAAADSPTSPSTTTASTTTTTTATPNSTTTDAAAAAATTATTGSSFDWQDAMMQCKKFLLEHRNFFLTPHVLIAAVALMLSLMFTGNAWVIYSYILLPLGTLVLRIVGVALGVGLGLGLAAHVYDQLQDWHVQHHFHQHYSLNDPLSQQQQPLSSSSSSMQQQLLPDAASAAEPLLRRRPSSSSTSLRRFYSGAISKSVNNNNNTSSSSNLNSGGGGGSSSMMNVNHQRWGQEENPYVVFMTSAGYQVGGPYLNNNNNNNISSSSSSSNRSCLLRGQVLRLPNTTGGNSDGSGSGADHDDFQQLQQQQEQLRVHRFTDVQPPEQQYAVQIMEQEWPLLPSSIRLQLGRWMEHILRDYVASWYSIIDSGCAYQEERSKRKEETNQPLQQQSQQQQSQQQQQPDTSSSYNTTTPESPSRMKQQREHRVMVLTTAGLRPCPTIEILYHTVATCFGNLAMRVESINVLELVLLKWTKVLAHTFKVYRLLRKTVVTKALAHDHLRVERRRASSSNINIPIPQLQPSTSSLQQQLPPNSSCSNISTTSTTTTTSAAVAVVDAFASTGNNINNNTRNNVAVSEMSMAREFMLAGKLHRAITFGMDVPSLLFADSTGKDCGWKRDPSSTTPTTDNNNNSNNNYTASTGIPLEDAVLEARLLHGNMMSECELDYNRVVGHGILRALLPRHEFSSLVVRSIMTEIMAGCVLSPIMSCFCPQSLNEWIIAGMDSLMNSSSNSSSTSSTTNESTTAPPPTTTTTTAASSTTNQPRDSPSTPDSTNEAPGVEMTMSKTELFAETTAGDSKGTAAAANGSNHSNRIDDMDASSSRLDMEMDFSDHHQQRGRTASADVGDLEGGDEDDEDEEEPSASSTGDHILPLLAMSLIELQQFMDFDECREARRNQQQIEVDWDDAGYRAAVLQLVLVIEAALLHGRRVEKVADHNHHQHPNNNHTNNNNSNNVMNDRSSTRSIDTEEPEESIEMTLPEYQSLTLSQMLMEMTSDMEAFEDHVVQEEERRANSSISEPKTSPLPTSQRGSVHSDSVYKPSATELSTLRTLIAAWLHTGLIHRVITLLIRATATVLSPYYHMHAFLRDADNAGGFARQLKGLDGVDILVDTISVLSSPSLDTINSTPTKAVTHSTDSSALTEPSSNVATTTMSPKLLKTAFTKSMKHFTETNLHRFMINGSLLPSIEAAAPPTTTTTTTQDELSPTSFMAQFAGTVVTPRFLDFQRNAAFAASLRSERERRLQSWADATKKKEQDDGVHVVCVRKGASEEEVARHRELHHLARTFYSGTTLVGIRDGTRRKESGDMDSAASTGQSSITSSSQPTTTVESTPISLLTVEMACSRRRIEVPDDDSSFLLRAQPRPLNAVGVHRDQRNHEQSYKCFATTYEEPAVRPGSSRFTGGRYVRQCLLRYYPSDRTASIVIQNDLRRMDQRKGRPAVPDSISIRNPASAILTNEFLRERHLCHKWNPKGSAPRSGSILASSVMEPTEFNAAPRSGKAFDFVYRVSLFESPMIELGGKRFTVHDASVLGTHRADASALEMSDATLSAALAIIGRDWELMANDGGLDENNMADPLNSSFRDQDRRPLVELGPDGYPIIWMKFQRKHDDKTNVEIKPYRTSFVRAALLLTGARQEAQLQCLVSCVRAGSAKSATKALTESHLKPTVRLLEYASSRNRELQSILLRDLKLGINHIDRDQLRRNHLLHPRYPTCLQSLSVTVESAVYAKDCGVSTPEAPSTVLYKIRCVAVVELIDKIEDDEVDAAYVDRNGHFGRLYREEWAVLRSFKDFQALHKHLKTQVAASEASGNTGTRIAGALAAAGVTGVHQRQRKALIPSLGSANKAGALGVTKKAMLKRKEVLDGYLRHLLLPNHLLNRTPEVLLFVGASHPFSREVGTGEPPVSPTRDLLGRIEMRRTIVAENLYVDQPKDMRAAPSHVLDNAQVAVPPPLPQRVRSMSTNTVETVKETETEEMDDDSTAPKSRTREEDMIPSIKARIDKVPLSQVRHQLFELLRYQFGFDNASFIRSRMLAALKTASFAVTTASEFRKTLYDLHTKMLNADSIADWIKFGLDMLWPNGVFIEFSKALTPEELQTLSDQSKKKLHEGFPDALRAVLGQDLTKDGLEIMHEMFQNRVVVKSMAYMLFDLLWLEVFPELDVLTGGVALDMD